MLGTCGTWVCAVLLDGMEAGQGVCEDAYPFVDANVASAV